MQFILISIRRMLRKVFVSRGALIAPGAIVLFSAVAAFAQGPVIVQPGAPGQPTKSLPSSTRAKLPARSPKDVEFMQGMIMHHAQAVEMVALMEGRTTTKELRLFGARISQSQSAEMNFMKRWLEVRGEPVEMPMAEMKDEHAGDMSEMHNMHGKPPKGGTPNPHHMLMPGMLTDEQMDALEKAKGAEFDRLFLTGMIQHHGGALTMVKEMFDTAGAGQDAELFNFATDVDSGQRAEIRVMQKMLGEKP